MFQLPSIKFPGPTYTVYAALTALSCSAYYFKTVGVENEHMLTPVSINKLYVQES